MRWNNKGYTYPFMLMLLVLFSMYLSFQIQFFLSEKGLYHESFKILKQEYYMHLTVKKIEASLINNSLSVGTGEYDFHNGTATFVIESISSSLLKATITIRLDTLEKNVGFAYYDKTQKKMTKWVERN